MRFQSCAQPVNAESTPYIQPLEKRRPVPHLAFYKYCGLSWPRRRRPPFALWYHRLQIVTGVHQPPFAKTLETGRQEVERLRARLIFLYPLVDNLRLTSLPYSSGPRRGKGDPGVGEQ